MGNAKIVYVVETVFTERDYKRFFVEEMRSSGFEVLILDLTPIFYSRIYDKVRLTSYKGSPFIKVCFSLSDFYKAIDDFKPEFCWNFVSPARKKYFKRLLVNFFLRWKTTVIDYNVINLPFVSGDTSFLKPLIRWVRLLFFFPFAIAKPQYSYTTNLSTLKNSRGRSIKIHEVDYDLYLQESRADKTNVENPYLLFLDEDCVFHSDFIYRNIPNPCSADIYFPEVNKALNDLAINLQLKPVVQLHPRARVEQSGKYYNAEISKRTTASAIRDSDLIVAHASTAIQLAVLFKKPILLLETKQYKQLTLAYNVLLSFQQILKCEVIDAESACGIKKLPIINQPAYEAYQAKYIKVPGTPEKFSHEIFSAALQKLVDGKR